MLGQRQELLDALNLAYRLRGQAVTERQESELLLSGIRAVLEANSPQDMYKSMFDVFGKLIPCEQAFVLEQHSPGIMQCNIASSSDFFASSWNIDSVLKRSILGEPCAVYAVNRQPAWSEHLTRSPTPIESALYCPFSGPGMNAILVLCHSVRGFYVQDHVQMAKRYKSFVEQTLLSVNAKLLALESQSLRQEKERVEQGLAQSEKMASLGLLAAGVAHEINNPIGFVSSNIKFLSDHFRYVDELNEKFSLLLRRSSSPSDEGFQALVEEISNWYETEEVDNTISDIRELMVECRSGLSRVCDIVEELRRFSRTSETSTTDVNINECIQSTLKLVHNELKYHCEIDVELGYVVDVDGNEGKINQVIMNLLVNAGQAITDRGEIHVCSGVSMHPFLGECTYFYVEDNGCGIAAENISKVFDPFYTSKGVNEGTGLGLSVSYSIIESMGGVIEVQSELNQFTRFTVYIPS